jgi:predicted phosphodiesterase
MSDRPSVAALARMHGIPWHQANRRYDELTAAGSPEPAPAVAGSAPVDSIVEAVLARLGLGTRAEAPASRVEPRGLTVRHEGRPARVGVVTDTHYPYQDERAISVAMQILADFKPDLVVHLGDVFDFYMISRFAKDPKRGKAVREEIDSAKPLWSALDALGCDVAVIEGNHDHRFDLMLNSTGGMSGLVSVRDLTGCPERFWWLANQSHLLVGPMAFLHGDVRGTNGGKHAARTLMSKLQINFVCGHFHREDRVGLADYHGVPHQGVVVPCLSRVEEAYEYNRVPDSVNGLATVEIDHDENLAEVRTHVIDRGRCRAFGKTYRA